MINNIPENFLEKICLGKFTIISNIVDVEGGVNIAYTGLSQIPVKFGVITGCFFGHSNKLKNLIGAPNTCKSFDCDSNKLITLRGGPKQVKSYYVCRYNKLKSLIGAPEICNSYFSCEHNQLTSLEGCPRIIKSNLHCNDNPNLHVLYGLGRVESKVYYERVNDLNEWIIMQAKHDIFLSYSDIAKWIKNNEKYEYLLHAPIEIKKFFSDIILYSIDLKLL